MKNIYIGINCDIGEGVANENQLFPFISSCNIACGGHAGDDDSMLRAIRSAKQHGVSAGAHPSYPDRENFGRVSVDISREPFVESIRFQINSLISILEKENVSLHHIKAHGALYNDMAKNFKLALLFLKAIEIYKDTAFVYVPFGSSIEKEASEQGFRIQREAFADRNYSSVSSLVPRNLPNALIEDPKQVLEHILCMVNEQKVKIVDGNKISILADTYCVHGDTSSALQILSYLAQELPKHHIKIKK